jgi:hypothetical protein
MSDSNSADAEQPQESTPARKTAAQAFAEEIWRLVHQTGDAGALREYLLENAGCTPSQFETAKGYIRDVTALAEREAFLLVRGVYLTTTDANRCAEYVGWRLRRIDRELRRMRTGAIDPLGPSAQDHLVLAYYQDEIAHMLKAVDRMRALGFPVTAMPER